MAWQTRDVVDAMTAASGLTVTELRADGGASVMDVLCQFQADVLGVPVRRPVVKETTALGAAYLAGIAEGVWSTPADAAGAWQEEAAFTPVMPTDEVSRRHAEWLRGVDRARGWAREAAE
jgi:glycerol kinase